MKNSKSSSTKIKVNRSAVTGRFVSGSYVKKHPTTTVTETRKVVRKTK